MRYATHSHPPTASDFAQARTPASAHRCEAPMSDEMIENIKTHLGGDYVLDWLRAHDFAVDHDRLNFIIERPNPKGVNAVAITALPHGMFTMHCYGRCLAGSYSAPLLAAARQIVPENLATVLCQLTGIEEIHHRQF